MSEWGAKSVPETQLPSVACGAGDLAGFRQAGIVEQPRPERDLGFIRRIGGGMLHRLQRPELGKHRPLVEHRAGPGFGRAGVGGAQLGRRLR